MPTDSICAQASCDLFVDHGPNKVSVEYEH
jgi:hypothetical protein